MREFEKISTTQYSKDISAFCNATYDSIKIPERSTSKSACYDIHALGDYKIQPHETIKIPTGLKVCMEDDEVMLMFIRSSLATKYNLTLTNSVGVIDADYYNNDSNEGHFWIVIRNDGDEAFEVHNGDRMAQAMFTKYLVTTSDNASGTRQGGFGSTGK